MESIVNTILGVVWSPYLVVLCLLTGLYFSVRTRFIQLRALPDMLRLMFRHERSDAGVSPFQALSISLSSRVGVGNIAGVAMAIAFGGPGAIFWMWVMGFLGASTSYVECTLAQIYKTKDAEGRYRGGPAYYIEKAMGLKWYALAFAIATIIAAGFLMPGVQANAIADSIINACRGTALCGPLDGQAFGMESVQALKLGIGIVVALLLGVVIFGGVKRIANFAEVVVPFMAAGFILMAIIIMVINYDRVPEMFGIIFKSAFGTHAAFGAMMGLAVEWGIKRGIYANEAGQGSGPHAAAASEVSHPAKQGYVQAFAIYFDTMMVCTATAFLILASGTYNVYSPAGASAPPIFQGLAGIPEGAGYAQAGVEAVLPGWGSAFVSIAIFFFAFTTIMAYYYMAETNLSYINHNRKRPATVLLLRLGIIGMVVFGAFHNATLAWALGDIGVGLMAWLNIIAILIVQKPAMLALRDYERQKKLGLDPIFDPDALGIKNADFWRQRKLEQSRSE
ncbi:MAG TPA: sodium:alanine symporter [Stenotrophomonas sp.]|nr:sodium:alanine symporter [Stenotrophomonas sp.]